MMRPFKFRTVRTRLLALMAFVFLPIAIISIILATTTYRSVSKNIELAQLQTVSNYAVRARLWYRGSLRTLVSVVESIKSAGVDSKYCSLITQGVISGIGGFQAIHIKFPDQPPCLASKNGSFTNNILENISIEQSKKSLVTAWSGLLIPNARYDAVIIEGKISLVLYTFHKQADGKQWEAVLLVDPILLDQAFEIGVQDSNTFVALMKKGQQIIVSRNVQEADLSWLPQNEDVFDQPRRWFSKKRGDTSYVYATQLVTEPDLYVLARFDNETANAAFMQFLILCITPLLMLIILFVVYVRVIHFDIIQWIKGIEAAARNRQRVSIVLAPVDDNMPQDIRQVAEAFNEMVVDRNQREDTLRKALDANQYLLRELNHRVKNSLQVIQSYLALSRRQKAGLQKIHFAETEAMVQVISISYRFALQDGTMRPVPIKPLAEEVLSNLSSSLRGPDQWIDVKIDAEAGLDVDRIIPLGLAIVEGVVAALRAVNAKTVRVSLRTLPDGYIKLVITSDGMKATSLPPTKIIAGLAAQLQARETKEDDKDVVNWTFSP
jgi:two-component system, sensor histidine kinase PdtaS